VAEEKGSSEKVQLAQVLAGILSSLTLTRSIAILLLIVAGSIAYGMFRVTRPEWQWSHLLPMAIYRTTTKEGCIYQSFKLENGPDVVIVYRYAARGAAILNLGYEADYLLPDSPATEEACRYLKQTAGKLKATGD
jgi:hypothetical protein